MNNTQLIYNLIRDSGPISRTDVYRNHGIRQATVTRITQQLLEKKLICFSGRDIVSRGRSPELLAINDTAFYVLGIHAASKLLRGAVVSAGGIQRDQSTAALPAQLTNDIFLKTLSNFVRQMLDKAHRDGINIASLALALPGEVDCASGSLAQAAVILPGLAEVPCKSFLEKKFNLPVTVDHDAAMMTYAEFLWGQGKMVANLGTLFVGHGIGGSFIINGELFRGARNRAGELGHIPLLRKGPLCKCGLRGCVEALAAIPAIEKNYSGNIAFADVVTRAEAGEAKAVAVLNAAAEYLGEALAIIFDIMDIDMMVISGDIIKAEKIIAQSLLDSVMRNSHSKQPPNREFLKFSRFGAEIGALGAAAAGVKMVFKDMRIEI